MSRVVEKGVTKMTSTELCKTCGHDKDWHVQKDKKYCISSCGCEKFIADKCKQPKGCKHCGHNELDHHKRRNGKVVCLVCKCLKFQAEDEMTARGFRKAIEKAGMIGEKFIAEDDLKVIKTGRETYSFADKQKGCVECNWLVGDVHYFYTEDVKTFIAQRNDLDMDLRYGKIRWEEHTIEKIKLAGERLLK